MNSEHTLTVVSDDKRIELPIRRGENVFNVLSDSGFADLDAPCGGSGLCGKCLVEVIGDDPCQIHPDERRLLSSQQLQAHQRLCCRMFLTEDADLTISVVSRKDGAKIVSSYENNESFHELRRSFSSSSYGFASDIGTTTIVVYCVSLESGQILDHRSSLNPQSSFGADVISRIEYSREHETGLSALHEVIAHHLHSLMMQMMDVHHIHPQEVKEIVAVGNPTMIHFLLKKDPAGIAVAPFIPSFYSRQQLTGTDVGWDDLSDAALIIPGLVSAYIGSDITAGVCSTDMLSFGKRTLYIDIGTNGEIVLFDGKTLHCCSSAAGPAFEGASISCGIGAVRGAIDHIWLDASQNVCFSTIDSAPPAGICGSAVIETVALLLDLGVVDETGAMEHEGNPADRYLTDTPNGKAFKITETMTFSNKDIREVQLAKAAIAAGCELLLKEADIELSQLDSLIIAGGFGAYINIEKAKRIGLLPPLESEKITAVGNAAGKGALDILLYEGADDRTENIRSKARYIELSNSQQFNELFIEQMFFKEGW